MKAIVFSSIILLSHFSVAQETMTLEDCLELASEKNINVQREIFNSQRNLKDVKAAKGEYLPDLSFSAYQGFNLGSSFNISTGVGQLESRYSGFSLNSSLTLFDGFKRKNQIRLAKLNNDKSQANIQTAQLEVKVLVINAYLNVLFNQAKLAYNQDQLEIAALEESRMNKLFENYLVSKTELLAIQSALNYIKNELATIENELAKSKIELMQLLQVEQLPNFNISEIDLNEIEELQIQTLNTFTEESLANNPILKATQLDTNIAEQNEKIMRSQYYPQLAFSYSYGSSYFHIQGTDDVIFNQETMVFEENGLFTQLDNNRIHLLSFSLTVPIFNRFKTSTSVDKAVIDKLSADLEYKKAKYEIQNTIQLLLSDMLTAKQSMDISKETAVLENESFNIHLQKFREGLIQSDVFLDSRTKNIEANYQLIYSKYDYVLKLLTLKYFTSSSF